MSGGKKARARKTNSHCNGYAKYKSSGRRLKNKERKQEKHKRPQAKAIGAKEMRLSKAEEACTLLRVGHKQLKRLIGTPNIRRLEAVLDGTYTTQKWYTDRKDAKDAKKRISRRKAKKRKEDEEISGGRNQGDGDIQVARERESGS